MADNPGSDEASPRPGWAPTLDHILVLGLVIVAAAGLSARRHPCRFAQFARGLGGSLAVAALCLGPVAAAALYLGALATPEDYRRPAWWRGPLGPVHHHVGVPPAAQPAGVLLACELQTGVGFSLAWLAPNQPRATWTEARLLPLHCWDMGIAWSPDGTRAAWRSWGQDGTPCGPGWLSGVVEWSLCQGRSPEPTHVSALDTGTDRTVRVTHDMAAAWLLEHGFPWSRNSGPWYSNTWLTGHQGAIQGAEPRPLGIGFVNVDDGSSRVCGLPSVDSGERWRHWAGNKVVLPNRAVFAAVWRQGA